MNKQTEGHGRRVDITNFTKYETIIKRSRKRRQSQSRKTQTTLQRKRRDNSRATKSKEIEKIFQAGK